MALAKAVPAVGSGAATGIHAATFDQALSASVAAAKASQDIYGSQLPCMGQGISTNDILQIMGVPIAPKFKGSAKSIEQAKAKYAKQLASQADNATALANFLNSAEAQKDGLTTVAQVADFLANVRLETTSPRSGAGLTALTEAGSPDDLRETYGNYQGRGDLMTTSSKNYGRASQALFGDKNVLLKNPDLVANDPAIAARTAGFFWKDNKLSKLADKQNIDGISIAILGKGALKKASYDQTRLQRVNNAKKATIILGNCGSTSVTQPGGTSPSSGQTVYAGNFSGTFTDGPFFGSDGGKITVTVTAGQDISTAVASAIDQLINSDLANERQSLKPGESLASGTRSVTVSGVTTSVTTVKGSYSASGGSGLTSYHYSGGFTIAPPVATA